MSVEQTDRQTDTHTDGPRPVELTQDEAGLATRWVSSRWYWGRCHRAGHRGSRHRLLFNLPHAGLQICIHVF